MKRSHAETHDTNEATTSSWFLKNVPPVMDKVRITHPTEPRLQSSSRYKYGVICSSNINRSMEAHAVLLNK